MQIKSVLSRFLELLFPPRCALCGAVIPAGVQVCTRCRQENPCVHAEKRIDLPEGGKTISCKVPYRYEGKIREAIIRFKFYGRTSSAIFFGERVADEFAGQADQFDFITSVPVSAQRKKRRGYNQSELIARNAAQRLRLPYAEVLEKIADNPEQHKLSREDRKRNVCGVYRPLSSGTIQGKRILLIDDIVTTGATLGECAKELLEAGAQAVTCAAIAEVEYPQLKS